MATISVTPTHIDIKFSTAEKVGGLVRDQHIARTSVTSIVLVEDGYAGTAGMRAPGLGIPGRRKIGTWRAKGRRQLVSVRRGESALRIELTGQRFDALVIGSPNAAALAADFS